MKKSATVQRSAKVMLKSGRSLVQAVQAKRFAHRNVHPESGTDSSESGKLNQVKVGISFSESGTCNPYKIWCNPYKINAHATLIKLMHMQPL